MKQPDVELYAALLRNGPHGLLSTPELARVEAHIEDGLTGAPILQAAGAATLVDVGTGGGLPGIPLALTLPDATVHLVESQRWKAEFLTGACARLSLDQRVHVWPQRAESAVAAIGRETLDAAVCRALASPAVCAEYLAPFVRIGGTLLLWTTGTAVAEHERSLSVASQELGLGEPVAVEATSSLRNDGVLLLWPKLAPTPDRYPRRVGVAAKRPLA